MDNSSVPWQVDAQPSVRQLPMLQIAPVAVLEETELNGESVMEAPLRNVGAVLSMDLRQDDYVVLMLTNGRPQVRQPRHTLQIAGHRPTQQPLTHRSAL